MKRFTKCPLLISVTKAKNLPEKSDNGVTIGNFVPLMCSKSSNGMKTVVEQSYVQVFL